MTFDGRELAPTLSQHRDDEARVWTAEGQPKVGAPHRQGRRVEADHHYIACLADQEVRVAGQDAGDAQHGQVATHLVGVSARKGEARDKGPPAEWPSRRRPPEVLELQ